MTSQCPLCLYNAPLPGFEGICPQCRQDPTEALAAIRFRPLDPNAPQAETLAVSVMVVDCPCGCGALTRIPCGGYVLAHLWPDQIRFTLKLRPLGWLVWRLFRCRPPKGRLVILEFSEGGRLFCSPAALRPGHGPDLATERPLKWERAD